MAGTTSRNYTIPELNGLSNFDFVQLLGPLYEHSVWIAEIAATHRPFENLAALQSTFTEIVATSPHEKQMALIQAHPDLAGRLAQLGALTPESTREQTAAGLDQLDSGTLHRLQRLNHNYRSRFGFPFIICARLNRVDDILRSMETRLSNSPKVEIATALSEIEKIATLRLRDLISMQST